MEKPDECFTYIVATLDRDLCHTAPIKVGITHNLNNRISSIRTHCPNKVEVAFAFRFASRHDALLVEKMCHRDLRRWHRSGEWFDAHPVAGVSLAAAVVELVFGRAPLCTPAHEAELDALGVNAAFTYCENHMPAPIDWRSCNRQKRAHTLEGWLQ